MRKKTQVTNQFEVDTEGSCFMCFKEISPRARPLRKSVGGHSSDDSDTDEDNEDGGHGPDKRRRRGSYCRSLSSLQKLSRYLHLNMQKVFNSETTTSIPVQLLPTLQRSELKVSLCGECGTVIDKFEVSLAELQKIQLQLGYCMKTVLGKLLMAEGEEAKEGHWSRIRESPQAVMHIGIVENLRKEAIEKCSSKVDILYPKVQLEPLSEKCLEELAWKSEELQRKNCNPPPPNSPAKKDDESEDEGEGGNSTDSDEVHDIRPTQKGKVKRVRRVIPSGSSSSSSSDSDDESVLLELRSMTRQKAKAKLLSNTRKNLNSSLFNQWKHSLSMRRDSEKSIDSSLAETSVSSIPEPSSRAQVRDDPVKRLYPFKCQTCRKRFKTEDKLNSHDHSINSISSEADSSVPICSSPPRESKAPDQPKESPLPETDISPRCSTPKDSVEVIEIIDIDEESMVEDEHENPKECQSNSKGKVIPKLLHKKKSQSPKAIMRPVRKCTLNSGNKRKDASSSQQSRNQNSLKRKLVTTDKNAVGRASTYKLKCSYCSMRFKLEKDLENHIGFKHAVELPNKEDTSTQPKSVPSVPILVEPEDNFKIEYILPNPVDEDMKVVTVTEEVLEVDLDISDRTNEFIEDLLQIPSPHTTTGSEDAGSSHDDDIILIEASNNIPLERIKEEEFVKVETESKSAEGGWMSIGAKFGMNTPDVEIEGEPPNLEEKIEECILNDEIKKECLVIVPMITDDVDDEVVEIDKNATTSPPSPFANVRIIDCVHQPIRES